MSYCILQILYYLSQYLSLGKVELKREIPTRLGHAEVSKLYAILEMW